MLTCKTIKEFDLLTILNVSISDSFIWLFEVIYIAFLE